VRSPSRTGIRVDGTREIAIPGGGPSRVRNASLSFADFS